MALPIRDGNQSLTTLSTIVVSSAHIPAHTVVSLGAQAITDIATAVSGVELGPNTLNALENITVTLGQVTITGGLTDAQLRASAVTVGGGVYLADAQAVIGSSIPPEVIQIGGKSLADSKLYPIAVDSNGVQSISGAVTASISGTPSVTFGTAVITGSTSVLNFPATQPVSIASVTIGNSVTIGSLPNISGTVTVSNLPATQAVTFGQSTITGSVSVLNLPATQTVTFTQASVTFSQPTITGSVSVLNFPASQSVTFTTAVVTFGTAVVTGSTSIIGTPSVTFGLISGTVTANPTGTQTIAGSVTLGAGTAQIGSVTASISGTPSVTFGTAVITGSTSIIGTATITGSTSILNFPATQTVTFSQAPVTFGTAVITGSASILNFPATQTVTFTQIATHGVTIANTSVTVNGTFYQATQPVSLATLPALVAGTAQIGSVTASISGTPSITFGLISGTVTIGNSVTISSLPSLVAGTAQIGSVTASISNSVTIASLPAISGTVTANASFASTTATYPSQIVAIGYKDEANTGNILAVNNDSSGLPVFLGSISVAGNQFTELPSWLDGQESFNVPISGTVTIGSLPAISGTVTANLSISSTVITSGSFTSLTSATLVPANPARKMATVFNLGAGQLFINAGVTATTLGGGFMVALSSGDFYECNYTTTTLSAIFANAGTASWVSY